MHHDSDTPSPAARENPHNKRSCLSWQMVCTSNRDARGPCAQDPTARWDTLIEVERADLPGDECGDPACVRSLLRVTIAAFDTQRSCTAHAGAMDRLYGAIVDVSLSDSDPGGDSRSTAAALADLEEFPEGYASR